MVIGGHCLKDGCAAHVYDSRGGKQGGRKAEPAALKEWLQFSMGRSPMFAPALFAMP